MINPLRQLKAHGQSVWYDNIDRAQLLSGLFQRLIDEDGIVGTTANPTIFEQSISLGTSYDEQVRQLIKEGKRTKEIYEALVMMDVRMVADKLRPVYEQTNGQDGFVSLEVSPDLAHDTEATLAEVRRFWNKVDRPNLLVKIPATSAGIPAIRQALSDGININITLIFALENYRQVVEAYLGALEERRAKGQDISYIASVASFFVSRVDVLVDTLLDEKITAVGESVERQKLQALQGKAAIANARLVYQEFKRLFDTPRFETLKRSGAHVQRPLWASTSTKNPAYRDVLYAEELIGPDTVDTMPLQTIEHFRDHGRVRHSIEDNIQEAKSEIAALEEVGILYDQVTRQLQEEGVQKFADSFHRLFQGLCWEILSGQVDKARKVIEGMVKTFMHLLPFTGMGVEGKMEYPLLRLFCEYARLFRSAVPLFALFLRCTDMLSKFPSRVFKALKASRRFSLRNELHMIEQQDTSRRG